MRNSLLLERQALDSSAQECAERSSSRGHLLCRPGTLAVGRSSGKNGIAFRGGGRNPGKFWLRRKTETRRSADVEDACSSHQYAGQIWYRFRSCSGTGDGFFVAAGTSEE